MGKIGKKAILMLGNNSRFTRRTAVVMMRSVYGKITENTRAPNWAISQRVLKKYFKEDTPLENSTLQSSPICIHKVLLSL